MTAKPTLGQGNAAERLKVSRPMPVFAAIAPLPAEGVPAVPVAVAKAKPASGPGRSYRISTYMTEEAGARLNKLIAHLKATEGRRRRAPDVLERALVALERELGL